MSRWEDLTSEKDFIGAAHLIFRKTETGVVEIEVVDFLVMVGKLFSEKISCGFSGGHIAKR